MVRKSKWTMFRRWGKPPALKRQFLCFGFPQLVLGMTAPMHRASRPANEIIVISDFTLIYKKSSSNFQKIVIFPENPSRVSTKNTSVELLLLLPRLGNFHNLATKMKPNVLLLFHSEFRSSSWLACPCTSSAGFAVSSWRLPTLRWRGSKGS